jgi:hypothetical protein
MKTITKSLVLISLMMLAGGALMAQKNLLLQDIQPMMSYSSESRSDIILSADYNSNSYQFYLEDKIQLKDWMVDRTEWTGNLSKQLHLVSKTELENKIELEDWMIGDDFKEESWLSELVKEQEEVPLKLQDWMLCCKEWQAVRL